MSSQEITNPKYLFDAEHNPCGKVCDPLNTEYCFLVGTKDPTIEKGISIARKLDGGSLTSLSQVMCRMLVEVLNLKSDISGYEEEAEFYKSGFENLTNDTLTGLLTGKGMEAFLEELYTPDIIRPLVEKHTTARIIYADVNDLKKHNEGPGGHEQGDLALKTIGKALGKYMIISNSRRKTDLIDEKRDRRNSPQSIKTIAARSKEKGDEFFAMFINPRNTSKSKNQLVETLDRALSNLYYHYDGVRYAVSVTYGVTDILLPKTLYELEDIIKKVDIAMMRHKEDSKQKNITSGIYVNINNS